MRDAGVVFLAVAAGLVVGMAPMHALAQEVEGERAPSPVAAGERLGVEAALERVRDRNETWAVARARIRQSEAARRESRAALLPSLVVNGGVTAYGREIVFGADVVQPRFDWRASGTASLVLVDLTQYPLLRRAEELVEATKAEAQWQRATVEFEARRAFWWLAAAQEQVKIAEKTVELRQAELEQARALLQAGIAVGLDVTRAKTNLLAAEQAKVDAEAALGDAQDALAALMGDPVGASPVAVYEEGADAERALAAKRSELGRRADLVAAQRRIDAIDQEEQSTWWSLFPRLGLSASGVVGPETTFGRPDGYRLSLTLDATWVLYDGGARYARLDQVEARGEQARLEYSRALREAGVQASRARRALRASRTAVGVAQQQVVAAQQTYEAARRRFENGLTSYLDVIDASEQLFGARVQLNQRRLDARVAAAEVNYLETLIGRDTP